MKRFASIEVPCKVAAVIASIRWRCSFARLTIVWVTCWTSGLYFICFELTLGKRICCRLALPVRRISPDCIFMRFGQVRHPDLYPLDDTVKSWRLKNQIFGR